MINVNENYRQFTGTENYYKYNSGLLLTDGVRQVAEDLKCFWLIDIIASYQHKINLDFQVWKLSRTEGSMFVVTCQDGNYNEVIRQEIDYSDFEGDELTVWCESPVLLLPTEH